MMITFCSKGPVIITHLSNAASMSIGHDRVTFSRVGFLCTYWTLYIILVELVKTSVLSIVSPDDL